ncbi:MAG: hypothetical protein A3C35_05160 [Omnitrophica bacterium RIFCSPHIGHO2_02_FULL_46_11]|nr:MAG: hypothetical protein A3C35_05160 [Omnitrophica bacterium RIFCSPHIGHO2_02_FULL_46_11]OGW86914.1 MAG: hypothetical protein A3A81_00180 [Omnitrophica bacterium RIFCSPLOWO2_01_FULL_45_10b]
MKKRDLKLPVPKHPLPDPEPRNMDDYARLVLMNLQSMQLPLDYLKQREKESVNVPFRLAA